jgi:hypothetical protein
MMKGILAAVGAMVACAPTAALGAVIDHSFIEFQCDVELGGCGAGIFQPSLDYEIPDNGQTYKWTYLIKVPGATFEIGAPGQVEQLKYYRAETGYNVLNGPDFHYRFDETVAPSITTVFAWVPKAKSFPCNEVGELCSVNYRVWGNGTQAYFTGIPPSLDKFYVEQYIETVPEPSTWATLILGFGAVGLAARRAARHRRSPI